MIHRDIDVVILCGGLGTRLRSILHDKQPKSMTLIKGKPFLDIILGAFKKFGFKRYVLCVGYKAEYIKNYYQKGEFASNITLSKEDQLLGTAGAIKNAQKYIHGDNFFVVNGDTYSDVSLISLENFHMTHKNALVSMSIISSNSEAGYGQVEIEHKTGLITSFAEKVKSKIKKYYINSGVYIFKRKVLSFIPPKKYYSLEYSLFPTLVSKSLYGFISDDKMWDIGTPVRYQKALKDLK